MTSTRARRRLSESGCHQGILSRWHKPSRAPASFIEGRLMRFAWRRRAQLPRCASRSVCCSSAPRRAKHPRRLDAKLIAPREAKQLGKVAYGFNGNELARLTNLTPYTDLHCDWHQRQPYCDICRRWDSDLTATLKPGQDFVYRLGPHYSYHSTQEYDGWFTYRADTLPNAEYLRYGNQCTGICLLGDGPRWVSHHPEFPRCGPGAARRKSMRQRPWIGPEQPGDRLDHQRQRQRLARHRYRFDFTFQTRGNYVLDASRALPHRPGLHHPSAVSRPAPVRVRAKTPHCSRRRRRPRHRGPQPTGPDADRPPALPGAYPPPGRDTLTASAHVTPAYTASESRRSPETSASSHPDNTRSSL